MIYFLELTNFDEVIKMLKQHEQRISKLESSFTDGITPSTKKKGKKVSITDLIVEVKNDGFFDKPKFQREIVEKFEEMGHIYDTKSLSGPLSRALKSRILGRKKIDGNWAYVRR